MPLVMFSVWPKEADGKHVTTAPANIASQTLSLITNIAARFYTILLIQDGHHNPTEPSWVGGSAIAGKISKGGVMPPLLERVSLVGEFFPFRLGVRSWLMFPVQ